MEDAICRRLADSEKGKEEMKRELTYQEIQDLIEEEDICGVNDCLQQIFASTGTSVVEHKKDYIVMGEFNNQNRLGEYEVINLNKRLKK